MSDPQQHGDYRVCPECKGVSHQQRYVEGYGWAHADNFDWLSKIAERFKILSDQLDDLARDLRFARDDYRDAREYEAAERFDRSAGEAFDLSKLAACSMNDTLQLGAGRPSPDLTTPSGHKRTCPAYGNYQPPYEKCDCGAESPFSGEPDPTAGAFPKSEVRFRLEDGSIPREVGMKQQAQVIREIQQLRPPTEPLTGLQPSDLAYQIVSADEILADLDYARSSHLAWAEHLEAHAARGIACVECEEKPYKLDAAHEREWIAKYDRLIAVVKVHATQQAALRDLVDEFRTLASMALTRSSYLQQGTPQFNAEMAECKDFKYVADKLARLLGAEPKTGKQ